MILIGTFVPGLSLGPFPLGGFREYRTYYESGEIASWSLRLEPGPGTLLISTVTSIVASILGIKNAGRMLERMKAD